MSSSKLFGSLLGFAALFPFVAIYAGWWSQLFGDGQGSIIIFYAYVAVLFAVFCSLLLRSTVIPKRERVTWLICLLLFLPLAALALVYRLYWHKPVRVAKSVEEQVAILRELRRER